MTDDDLATQREEADRALALMVRRPVGPAPTGYCLNCDEPVGEGVRWCDADCRLDWSRREGGLR